MPVTAPPPRYKREYRKRVPADPPLADSDRVQLAIEIIDENIGENKYDRAKLERDLLIQIGFIERQRNWKRSGRYGTWTKEQKTAASGMAAALRGVENARRNLARHYDDESYWYDRCPDEDELQQWRKYWEKKAATPLAQSRRRDPERGSTARDPARSQAAIAAARLLDKLSIPLKVSRKNKETGRWASAFCRLAAVLYGDKDADLYEPCREVLKERREV